MIYAAIEIRGVDVRAAFASKMFVISSVEHYSSHTIRSDKLEIPSADIRAAYLPKCYLLIATNLLTSVKVRHSRSA